MEKTLSELRYVFGRRVRWQRQALKLTQHALAARIGMQRSDLSNVEHGRFSPTLTTVERFAAAMGVSPDALLRE